MQVMMTAQRNKDAELCKKMPQSETRTYALCRNFFEEVFPHDPEMLDQAIPQRMNENVLLIRDAAKGRFTDESEHFGVGFTGWSWNARFADVDNDEWQDIYVVAGTWFRATNSGTTGNFFFHNEAGNRDGIGTVFTIHYGPGGNRHQMRELKASGGYLSFDEPIAHFGLGEYDSVERLEVRWSTGGESVIQGPFDEGYLYSLERVKSQQ
jgi:hypothetical protein